MSLLIVLILNTQISKCLTSFNFNFLFSFDLKSINYKFYFLNIIELYNMIYLLISNGNSSILVLSTSRLSLIVIQLAFLIMIHQYNFYDNL